MHFRNLYVFLKFLHQKRKLNHGGTELGRLLAHGLGPSGPKCLGRPTMLGHGVRAHGRSHHARGQGGGTLASGIAMAGLTCGPHRWHEGGQWTGLGNMRTAAPHRGRLAMVRGAEEAVSVVFWQWVQLWWSPVRSSSAYGARAKRGV
jgi:hypothetical protein